MIEIILKDKIEENKMEALIQFLKGLKIEAIFKQDYVFKQRKKVGFSLSIGLWKDYSIGGNELRNQSWDLM